MRRRAFTLVELLVVIGIIAVLIGLLLPTLAGARRNARTLRCAANLRSLGAAVVMYAQEHKGFVPTYESKYPNNVRLPWYDQLARYVFNRPAVGTPASVINIPDFERSIIVGCPDFAFSRLPGSVLNSSTGYSMTTEPFAPREPANPNRYNFLVVAGPGDPPAANPGRHFRLVEFKNPSNRALMADMNGYGGLRARDPDPLTYQKPPGNGALGDIDYFRHGKASIAATGPTDADLTRGRVNVLFADGHVEPCTPWGAWYAVRDPARRAAGSDKGY